MRLLARVYADDNTPSKVSVDYVWAISRVNLADILAVLAQLHKTEVYG